MTTVETFIARWRDSGASERANYQLFLTELCQVLGVPQPDPSKDDVAENAYVFERGVKFVNPDGTTSDGRIDLYKRGAFVLEAKQGSDAQDRAREEQALLAGGKAPRKRRGTAVRGTADWDDAMVRARGQADRYARALPTAEGWPPFLIVVDVGHSIELYSEFTRSGKNYQHFPDPASFRIAIEDLTKPEVRERLKAVWTDPLSLDPSRRAAKVTRELAERLAELAKLLEKEQHAPGDVAKFLMRSLFTMFAEDVDLIPRGSFKGLLESLADEPQNFVPMVEGLWKSMNDGGFSPILRRQVLRFNGGLFADSSALPLTKPMLKLLIQAAAADWTDVEPAIFGTLLERALDPVERHKLGAHFTPRAYVERLVLPTIIEPLREEWRIVLATAIQEAKEGDLPAAQATVRRFHDELCATRVLDPACGSANFLYVAMEHMKRLEGEILNALAEFGYTQRWTKVVDPNQFLGIEINPRAAAIADLVLWIGYLQWHFRTQGRTSPAEPIIKDYNNIQNRDAVLAWDRTEPLLDDAGKPVTRWDGRTMKRHPVTGEDVPDDTARVAVLKYVNPRKATWPEAEYVVGNPPFIGVRHLKTALGDAYVNSLRTAFSELPETIDFVAYWWDRAAEAVRFGTTRRFGLITTNSLTQGYSRPIIDRHLVPENGIRLVFAIADHPWGEADDYDRAAVRIAMTVGESSSNFVSGRIGRVVAERGEFVDVSYTVVPEITSNLDANTSLSTIVALTANKGMCFQGVVPAGSGFKVDACDTDFLSRVNACDERRILHPYVIGRDLVQRAEVRFILDCFGLSERDVRTEFPNVFQRLRDRVYPFRRENKRASYRDKWWVFAEPRPALRNAQEGLCRYIGTPYTAKHRPFSFVPANVIPDAMVYAIVSDDAYVLATLSSTVHSSWCAKTGGTLEDRLRYNSKKTFLPFPFPNPTEPQKTRIRDLGEQLDAHRKRQQAAHEGLTLTGMYNVLEKLRSGEALTPKEQKIHEQGLVSVLKQIHDDLDAAVFEAYGWPTTLTDDEILERLVALNAERHAEEQRGLVRWLRPDYQIPLLAGGGQKAIDLQGDEDDGADDEAEDTDETPKSKPRKPTKAAKTKGAPTKGTTSPAPTKKPGKQPWPAERAERTRLVQQALASLTEPRTPDEIAKGFTRARAETVEDILEALASLGLARKVRGGKYAGG